MSRQTCRYVLINLCMCVCMHVYMCACMYLRSLLPCHCTHNWHATEKICHHTANITNITIMLNGNIDPAFFHRWIKTQPTAIVTSHVLPYMYQNLICPSNHICQVVHVQVGDNYIYICASYELNAINYVTSNSGIHNFTLLPHAPEQIYVPKCTYMSHCTATVVYI